MHMNNLGSQVSEKKLPSANGISAFQQNKGSFIISNSVLKQSGYDSQDSEQVDVSKTKFSLAMIKKEAYLIGKKKKAMGLLQQDKLSITQQASFSNLTDAKQVLIYPSLSNSVVAEVPNPLCIGCIKFFYSHLPYNFEQSYQKPVILSTLESKQISVVKNIVYTMLSKRKQYYVLVTETKNLGNKVFVQGFLEGYDYQKFIQTIKQLVRQITYRSGQASASLINFSMDLIPLLEDQFINEPQQQSYINNYFFHNVLRLRFSPCLNSKKKSQMKLGEVCRALGKVRKVSLCHWPIQCYEPIRFEFVPYMKKRKAYQLVDQKNNKYENFTMANLQSHPNFIEQLEKFLKNNNIEFSIFRPFSQLINIKLRLRRYEIFFINHKCSHRILAQRIRSSSNKEISTLNISYISRYMVIQDEEFFSKHINKFARQYDSVTDDGYAMFNIKKGLKLEQQIKSLKIYVIFGDVRSTILACCILNDFGMRRIKLISEENIY